MKEQKKKRFIAILLLVSCLISGFMLFATSDDGAKRLHNLSQADSLIHRELHDFNISDNQVRLSTVRVDSNFRRKTYRVRLPYRFSKTQFHAELNKAAYKYGIETPAEVHFPEKDVSIHLLYHDTVIRSVLLQTDAELVLDRNEVSLLVAFDEQPDEELLNRLAALGEPIPLVIKIENPIEANDLQKQLDAQYDHLLFWLQSPQGEDLINTNLDEALPKLKQIADVLPDAQILQYRHSKQRHRKLTSQTDLTFINASNALLLHEDLGKATFFEELHKLQSNRKLSMAVITGTETTLSWLQQKLPELKKAGIKIVPPPKMNF